MWTLLTDCHNLLLRDGITKMHLWNRICLLCYATVRYVMLYASMHLPSCITFFIYFHFLSLSILFIFNRLICYRLPIKQKRKLTCEMNINIVLKLTHMKTEYFLKKLFYFFIDEISLFLTLTQSKCIFCCVNAFITWYGTKDLSDFTHHTGMEYFASFQSGVLIPSLSRKTHTKI
jgi:hypothetical protein